MKEEKKSIFIEVTSNEEAKTSTIKVSKTPNVSKAELIGLLTIVIDESKKIKHNEKED